MVLLLSCFFLFFCPPLTFFLIQDKLRHPSSHQRGGKFLQLIPSPRSGTALLRACMTSGLSSWQALGLSGQLADTVSKWVCVFSFSWMNSLVPFEGCHGLTVSWLGIKEEKYHRVLSKPAIWCPCRVCGWGKGLHQSRSDKLFRHGGKGAKHTKCHTCSPQLPLWGQMNLWSS